MSRAPWLIPAAMFVGASVLYVLLGSLQEIPLVADDEFLYGELSRSVADGDGLALHGTSQKWPSALYIFLIAPAWLGASVETGYGIAKAIGAVAISAVVFPTWLLARRFVAPGPAAVATGLAVAGSWMVSAAGLLTETLAYPLATASLACAVLMLREPELRWFWFAFGFAALAALTRAQMAVLFVVLLAALALEIVLAEDRRAALERRRIEFGLLGVVIAAGAIIVLSGSETGLGRYAALKEFRPSLGETLGTIGRQYLALVAAAAFLPVAVLLAFAGRRASWRDPDVSPLLCVIVPAIVLLAIQSGYFLAGLPNNNWSVERYMVVVIPLLFVLTVMAFDRRLLTARELAIAGAVAALPLLAVPEIRVALEEAAQFGIADRFGDVLGLGAGPALALAAILVTGAGVLILARLPGVRGVVAAGALILCVLVVQSQAIWNWHFDYSDAFRSQYPDDLSWVDDEAGGPVNRISVFASSPLFQVADFFNEEVGNVLTPGADPGRPKPPGRVCLFNADERGTLQISPGCKVERRFWNDDPLAVLSFHDGRTVARDANLGQIVEVPARPRLRSIVRLPCQRQTLRGGLDGSSPVIPKSGPCGPTMAVDVWADDPGVVELTFAGGTRAYDVQNETRRWTLAPRVPTRVRVRAPAGQSTNGFEIDWTQSLGAPRLVGAALISGGTRTSLL